MKKTSSKTKKALRNRTRLEWLLFAALLLIFYLFLASRHEWWPLNSAKENLGTAFYTSRTLSVPEAAQKASQAAGTSSGAASTAGRSTSDSTTTRSTSTTTNGSGGGSTTAPGGGGGGSGGGSSSTAPLLSFAAGVNVGDSKQQISAQVGGLGQNCAITVNLPLGLGKQEVCTYTKNGGTVTVTYLNDRVLSASLAGL